MRRGGYIQEKYDYVKKHGLKEAITCAKEEHKSRVASSKDLLDMEIEELTRLSKI